MRTLFFVTTLLITIINFTGAYAASLQLVSFNVENLFDWEHDPKHDDFEYLPTGHPAKEPGCREGNPQYIEKCLRSNWTQAMAEQKINQIVLTLQTTLSPEKSVDFLALQEIESALVAQKIADKIGNMGMLITSGADGRGINVALLYKLSGDFILQSSREIKVESKHLNGKQTRNILEAVFQLKNGEKLAIYVNHWPSQNNSPLARLDAAKVLKKARFLARLRGIKYAVAMGDFNVVDSDFPHPLKAQLQQGLGKMIDVQDMLSDAKKNALPMGTYFFSKRMQWNVLDRFFVSPSMQEENAAIRILPDSYQILRGEINSTEFKYNSGEYAGSIIRQVPRHFNTKDGSGVTDHFPIALVLEY